LVKRHFPSKMNWTNFPWLTKPMRILILKM
jgi:hypothetical protein